MHLQSTRRAKARASLVSPIPYADFPLSLSIGTTAGNNRVERVEWTWAKFYARILQATRLHVSSAEFAALPREQQNKLKDVGHYVPGHFANNIRKRENLTKRCALALDIDHATPGTVAELRDEIMGIGEYIWLIHHTAKSTPQRPRLRLVVPLARPVDATEHEAVARWLASQAGGLDLFDDTTFQWSRLMHWPAMCADGPDAVTLSTGRRMLDPEEALRSYRDWRDVAQWPISARVDKIRLSEAKAEDPREKDGLVGAFCRAFPIREAAARFLPGVYVDGSNADRMTYAKGTASNGAVIYDHGAFLYSHHESDPAGGRLVNAFDLVRLHIFGTRDDDAAVPLSELPSQRAMLELAGTLPEVRAELEKARFGDFDDAPVDTSAPPDSMAPSAPSNVPREVRDDIEAADARTLFLPNDWLPVPAAAERIFRTLGDGRELFRRGDAVVELTDEDGLRVVTPAAFRSRLNGRGRKTRAFKVSKAQRIVHEPKACSEDAARVLLAAREVECLPAVTLVTRMPTLTVHGDRLVTAAPGYNAESGVLVLSRDPLPVVPVDEAAGALARLLDDFAFVAPADRARALVTLVAPALRMGRLIPDSNALMTCVEANASQAGKGYFLELLREIYGESVALLSIKSGGVGSLDESLAAKLLEGRPFVQIDNVRGRVASQFLEAILTSRGTPVPCRVPHRAEVNVTADRLLLLTTSNGLEATDDLVNRLLLIRITKREPGYRWRTYPEGTALQHIAAQRGYYLACGHAVVRAWFEAGRPRLPTNHSFHEWVGSLEWIGQRVFGTGSILDGHSAAVSRVSNPSLSWLRLIGEEIVTKCIRPSTDAADFDESTPEGFSASALFRVALDVDKLPPGTTHTMQPEQGAQTIGRIMRVCFREADSVSLDSIVATRSMHSRRRDNRSVYEEARYAFIRRVGTG